MYYLHQKKNIKHRDIHGIVLVDKPKGQSSNAILQQVKHLFNAKKAGHTGALDPLASGILPICFGKATKISQFLLNADKRYITLAKLGQKTNTGDTEGKVIATENYEHLSKNTFEKLLKSFIGEIWQTPPMYSALKRFGVPLYRLAREGKVVERKARLVNIFSLKLIDYRRGLAMLDILCSKGTYVRTLVEDIGDALGCYAFVKELKRIGFAHYHIHQSVTLETLEKKQKDTLLLDEFIHPTESALIHYPSLYLEAEQTQKIKYGQSIYYPCTAGKIFKIFSKEKDFIAIAYCQNSYLMPKKLFA